MNIIWNVKTILEATGGSRASKVVKIDRMDRWEGISLSEPNLNNLRGIPTADITNNGHIFKSVPTEWYMVEH